jgi:hypothetical protein
MAGGTPPRHGVDWGRGAPTPIVGDPTAVLKNLPSGGGPAGPGPVPTSGALPVKVIDSFLADLPAGAIQQFSRVTEAKLTWGAWVNPDLTYKSQPSMQLDSFSVPDKYVYVFTDIKFYALCPSCHLENAFVELREQQLAGIVRFMLTFNGVSPMRQEANTFVLGTGQIQRTGWTGLNDEFGAQRTIGFALFARSLQVVYTEVQIDVAPRFRIWKFGAQFHGIAVPEATFEGVFEKRRG